MKNKKELLNAPSVLEYPRYGIPDSTMQEKIRLSQESRLGWWKSCMVAILGDGTQVTNEDIWRPITVSVGDVMFYIIGWTTNDSRCGISNEQRPSRRTTYVKWFKFNTPQDKEAIGDFIKEMVAGLQESKETEDKNKGDLQKLIDSVSFLKRYKKDTLALTVSLGGLKITKYEEGGRFEIARCTIDRYGSITNPVKYHKSSVNSLSEATEFVNMFKPIHDEILEIAHAIKEELPQEYFIKETENAKP